MFIVQPLNSLPLLRLDLGKALADGVYPPFADLVEGEVANHTQNAEQKDDQPGLGFQQQLHEIPFKALCRDLGSYVPRPGVLCTICGNAELQRRQAVANYLLERATHLVEFSCDTYVTLCAAFWSPLRDEYQVNLLQITPIK